MEWMVLAFNLLDSLSIFLCINDVVFHKADTRTTTTVLPGTSRDKLESVHRANQEHIRNCLTEPLSVDPVCVRTRSGEWVRKRGTARLEGLWSRLLDVFPVQCSSLHADLFIKTFFATTNFDQLVRFDDTWPDLTFHPLCFSNLHRCYQIEEELTLSHSHPRLPLYDEAKTPVFGMVESAKSLPVGLGLLSQAEAKNISASERSFLYEGLEGGGVGTFKDF